MTLTNKARARKAVSLCLLLAGGGLLAANAWSIATSGRDLTGLNVLPHDGLIAINVPIAEGQPQ